MYDALGMGNNHFFLLYDKQHVSIGSLGIAPTLLKFNSWSPVAGFMPIISTEGISQIKKGKL